MSEEGPKETKDDEKPLVKVDSPAQSNIEDLAERFRRLELKLGEQTNWDSQTQNPRPTLYCIMCRHSGHGIRECSESKFFIAQGICHMDLNNCVVMSDSSVLP